MSVNIDNDIFGGAIALPPEPGLDLDEEDLPDIIPGAGIPEQEDDDEDEEEEEDDDAEEELSYELTPYPDEKDKPGTRDQAFDSYRNYLIEEELKAKGYDPKDRKAVLQKAYQDNPLEMREWDKWLDKEAEKFAEKYQKEKIAPYEEQVENARLDEECAQVLEFFPDLPEYWGEIQQLAEKFFEAYPQLQPHPSKSLPVLYRLAVEMRNDQQRQKPRKNYALERNTPPRKPRNTKAKEGDELFKPGFTNPGDFIGSL